MHVYRVSSNNANKNNFIKRSFRILYASWKLFIKTLLLVKKGDVLLIVTNPAFLLLLMPIVKWLMGIKYWILVHDIFPENLVATKKIKFSSKTYKSLRSIFNWAYSEAVGCISIGRDMTEILKSKLNSENRIEFIPTWSENDVVFPMEKSKTNLCKKLGLTSKFVFQFAGNLGHLQGLDNILQAIALVENHEIHFLFIGDGAYFNIINDFSKQHTNVSIIGFQDRSTQNDFLNACDIAIVTLSDGMYGLGVPSKSYNIMAAGKPILMIGDSQSEISLCVKEYNLGWHIAPNNPLALKELIEDIYQQRENIASICLNARKAADTFFAKDYILNKYYQLFNLE